MKNSEKFQFSCGSGSRYDHRGHCGHVLTAGRYTYMKSVRTATLLVGVVVFLSACTQQAPTQTIATTQELMEGMVQPVAEVVWESVQTIVDREGVHEMQPQTEEEWDFVRFSALALAESANLIKVADRPLTEGTPERGDNWNGFADALIETSLGAAEAARLRDPEGLFTAGSNIYEDACLACHDAYLPENQQPF